MDAATVGAASCPCCPRWRERQVRGSRRSGPTPNSPHAPSEMRLCPCSWVYLSVRAERTVVVHLPLRTYPMTDNSLPSRPQELTSKSGDCRLLRPPAPLSSENNLARTGYGPASRRGRGARCPPLPATAFATGVLLPLPSGIIFGARSSTLHRPAAT